MSVPYMVFYVRYFLLFRRHETDSFVDLMLATIPSVFQDIYHFEVQYTGLAYLGCNYTHTP